MNSTVFTQIGGDMPTVQRVLCPSRGRLRLHSVVYVTSKLSDAPIPMRSGPAGIRGWLLVYVIALGVQALHDLGLTVAALVVHARPHLAGLVSFVPLPSLLVYVVSNLIVVLYTVVLYVLMCTRRKSAIFHNVSCNALAVIFLVCWHFLGMKSSLGTIVDSVPGIVGAWYILASQRVRNTFILT